MKQYIPLYLFTLLFFTACSPKHVQSPAILEIIDSDYRFSTDILLNFSKENNIDKSSVYQWQNHWVVYTDSKAAGAMKTKLENKFPLLIIKFYNKPFYNFNRQKQCHDKSADKWENIIMNANLLSDTVKQNEYMEYHRTQFEKWPEISKGFCNADFQQLLVFRYGRQLMLVISIGLSAILETMMPLILSGQVIEYFNRPGSPIVLVGMIVAVVGIIFIGLAGFKKEKDLGELKNSVHVKMKIGLTLAIIAGFLSVVFNISLEAGQPISDIAAQHGLVNLKEMLN